MNIKSLTIYCSSSNFLNKEFYDLANQIGTFLSNKGITIIYGGGKVGMMGEISKSAIKNNGRVIGIIPKFLQTKEIIDLEISENIVVNDMSDRKKMLICKGEAFLILPGGSGTIEEATEVISWSILGIHNKPVIIFNYKNYWDSLIDMYENAKIKKFGNINLQTLCVTVKTFNEFSSLFNK